jgi:tripartite-type tricarboxylate transporter receptor subunit TctC
MAAWRVNPVVDFRILNRPSPEITHRDFYENDDRANAERRPPMPNAFHHRRSLLAAITTQAALLAVATALPRAALAQQPSFAGKPIRIVVGFAAGGPTDVIARAVAERMAATLKTPVIVDNKPGAGGNIAAAEVAKAEPDGHTILAGIDTTFTINPAIYKTMPFGPDALKPLLVMASSGLLVGVNPSLKVRTLPEFIARARKDNLALSSAGNGSPGHFASAIFSDVAGAPVTHVPYKGNSPAVLAILSGEVQGGILSTAGMVPQVKAGKITPLAVTSRQRSAVMPDVPTVAEAGAKDLEFEVLQLAMVPAATPALVVEALRQAMADALDVPAVKAQLQQLDLVIDKQAGAAAQERLNVLRTRYVRVVKASGIKAD